MLNVWAQALALRARKKITFTFAHHIFTSSLNVLRSQNPRNSLAITAVLLTQNVQIWGKSVRANANLIFLRALGVCLFMAPGSMSAAQRFILLDATMDISFMPKEAYVFVQILSGTMMRLKGTIVPPFYGASGEIKDPSGKWLIGTRIPRPEAPTLTYSVLVMGTKGETAFTEPTERDLGSAIDAFESVEDLHEYINRQRDLLGDGLRSEKELEDELKRLRADVDYIADIGRIVEVKEDNLSLEGQLRSLEKDIAHYTHAFNQVNSIPTPKNFLRRESELNRQLTELNTTAKNVEENRHSSGEGGIEQKLSTIESVKDDNEQMLIQKLAGLRKYRIELQKESEGKIRKN